MNNLIENLSLIQYLINDTNQKVNNVMFAMEQKELTIDECLNEGIIVERADVDFDSLESFYVEAFSDYDFEKHNSSQGEKNLSFAKAVCTIIEASDDYHGKTIASDRAASIQMKGKDNNNTLKYEKLGELVKQFVALHPNYAKMTVVSDELGKDPKTGTPTLVVFIEFDGSKLGLNSNEKYWVTWHVMDPNNSRKASHKQKSGKLKTRISSYDVLKSFNHPSFKKLVKNNKNDDTQAYESLEKAYRAVPFNHKGDGTHSMLVKQFNLGKKNTGA